MNIKVKKSLFLKGLLIGGSFAGKARALPILDCVKIKVKGDTMNFVSCDDMNAISKRINGVESTGDVVFCVSYKSILSYVKLIGSEFIELIVGDDLKNIEVKHDKGSASFPLMNADEFPIYKPDDNGIDIEIEAALLNNWIVDAQNFVGNDELRPAMNTIYLYCSNGELGVCGSDGHYLFTDNIKSEISDFNFMLNNGVFKAVCEICKDSDVVKINIGEKNILFSVDGSSVLARAVEQRYPNFKSVIPANCNVSVKANRKEFMDAINRCKLGASQVTSLVKLDFNGINLEVSAQDIDFNTKTVENMFIESNGNVTIGFHAGKLISVLNSINTDFVIIELTDASRAGIFKEFEGAENKIILLMPMMLSD